MIATTEAHADTGHICAAAHDTHGEDRQYDALLARIRDRFALVTADHTALFTTDATHLFDAFLEALPADRRQHYRCNACKRFVDRFGGLVVIEADGMTESPLWESGTGCNPPYVDAPFFRVAMGTMGRMVRRAKVTGVFASDEATWGMPRNRSTKPPGSWQHIAVTPPAKLVDRKDPLNTVDATMARYREEHGMLCRGLQEFSIGTVRQAHTMLTNGALFRSEKCIGVAKWLLDLHSTWAGAGGRDRAGIRATNLTWLAVATAPAGFCHVRSTMIGTLLDDIETGMPFAGIKARFDAKMNPVFYQRPQAPPKDGNLAAAEAIVAALGSAGSLARRYATLADIVPLWTPQPVKATQGARKAAGPVFGHLMGKATAPAPAPVEMPVVTMTWVKFRDVVLPDAATIEFKVVPSGSYAGFLTAVDPTAPPILQWDTDNRRNPVSWYFYAHGSLASQWGLTGHAWVVVTAVALQPSMWHAPDAYAHHGRNVFFLLDGAKDAGKPGAGLFPEILRAEYHGIRAAMEALSRTATVAMPDAPTACGFGLQDGSAWSNGNVYRVTKTDGTVTTYKLDRWD